MRSTLLGAPPISVGQLVRVRSYGDRLPGTVTSLEHRTDGTWKVWVEVLANFGVGTSQHIVDSAGHEVHTRTEHHGLEFT